MKTLLLLRHAKSSWSNPSLDDHDRPLNKRGKRAAPAMGALLADEGLVPDLIVTSTAKRARSTAKRVARACGYDGKRVKRGDVYLASPSVLLDVIAQTPESVGTLMLVGHNPGMEVLVFALTGHQERFPTAALAHIALDIDPWRDVHDAGGRLIDLYRPRDLA